MGQLQELKQQKSELEEKILDIVSYILDELEVKLLEFSDFVGEKIFKAYPEVSSHFAPARLAAFKADLRQTAEEAVADLIGLLADETLWLTVYNNFKGKSSLRDNPKVWPAIQEFSQKLTPVLRRYGYPARTGTLLSPYKEADIVDISQFPRPDQLQLLCLKYWFHISKYCQLVAEIRKVQKVRASQELDKIWDAVE